MPETGFVSIKKLCVHIFLLQISLIMQIEGLTIIAPAAPISLICLDTIISNKNKNSASSCLHEPAFSF
jgi:hypothetical protein